MPPPDLKPCLTGAVIAKQEPYQGDVALLRQLISAPFDTYRELHLTTLYAWMELCQAIPGDNQSEPLIQQRLRLTLTALKLRRGKMLPLHSDSETIAEQEPLWTYALFTAGLLWRLFELQNYTIELYKNAGERLGLCHPLAGNLAEPNTYYKITTQAPAFTLDTISFQALVTGKIIPAIGLRWLAEYPAVFHPWWEVIIHQPQPNNPLMFLLQAARERLGLTIETPQIIASQHSNSIVPENNIEPTPAFAAEKITEYTLDALMAWLITQLHANPPLPLFLRVPQGLLVSLKALALFIEQASMSHSVEDLLHSLADLLLHPPAPEQSARLEKAETAKQTKNLLFRYRSVRFEQRQVLEGIIIKENHLSPALQAIHVQKHFVPDISLPQEINHAHRT